MSNISEDKKTAKAVTDKKTITTTEDNKKPIVSKTETTKATSTEKATEVKLNTSSNDASSASWSQW